MKKDILLFLLSMGILVYLFLGSGLLDPPELYLDTGATPTSESDGSPPLIIVIVPYRSPTPTINYSLPTQRPTYTPFVTYTPGPTNTPRPTRTPTSTPYPPQPFVFGPQARSTQSPPERCPVPDTGEVPPPPFYLGYDPEAFNNSDDFEFPTREAALEYLNKYGITPVRTKIETIAARRGWKAEWLRKKFFMQDLTNDGVPEIMMTLQVSFPYEPFIIIGCRQGKYVLLYEQDNVDGYLSSFVTTSIRDANRNGLPELLMITGYLTQGGHDYDIIEWDGTGFRSLLPKDDRRWADFFVNARGYVRFEDRDGDLVDEVVIESGIPIWSTYDMGLPWRNETIIYKWDGFLYRYQRKDMAPPEFRFQAVQDGDYYTLLGEYDKAASLYQQAIFDPDLEWWSPERREHLRALFYLGMNPTPEPTPTLPAPDPSEYGNLAAYARFRLMLLHLLRGWEPEAQIAYNELQKRFPGGQPGADFAAMGAAFWTRFQGSRDLAVACSAAREYITAHPEGLYFVGSDHHGWQGFGYTAGSLCPVE